MKNNLVYFILSALLLIKQSRGETENITDTQKTLWTPSGDAFRDAVIAKLAALSEEPLKLAQKLFEDTYADDKQDNEDVTKFLAEFLENFQKIKLDETPTPKVILFLKNYFVFDVASGLISVEKRYRDEVFAIKEALEKHDVKSVANEFHRKFDEFLEWLTKKIEENMNLNMAEQLRVKAFKGLCLQFKEATSMAHKEDDLRCLIQKVEGKFVEE